jgi:hypothetical protein
MPLRADQLERMAEALGESEADGHGFDEVFDVGRMGARERTDLHGQVLGESAALTSRRCAGESGLTVVSGPGKVAARVGVRLAAAILAVSSLEIGWNSCSGGLYPGCLPAGIASGGLRHAGWSEIGEVSRRQPPLEGVDSMVLSPHAARAPVALSLSFALCAPAWGQGAAPQLFCWGRNDEGQCAVPQALSDVIAVDGIYHTVALRSDGTVRAWGRNGDGQCNVPSNLADATAISAGIFHTLAQRANGSVVGWGRNDAQQCSGPAGVTGVRAIEACGYGSMVLKADGTVQTWGGSIYAPPTGLSGVVQIAGEDVHCAVTKGDGTVVCWGSGTTTSGAFNYGQSIVPTGLANVQKVATGSYHTLALKTDGSLVIWGLNDSGQRNVPAGNTFVDMDGGNDFSIGLTNQGKVLCWGGNGFQQLSVPASAQSGVYQVAAGGWHGIALQGPPITIQTVRPISGSIEGGTPITILGSNFRSGSIVTIGGVPATDMVVVSPSMITAKTPPGAVGPTNVAVDFGTATAFYYSPICSEDVDGDGEVGGSDISLLLLNFGPCATTP